MAKFDDLSDPFLQWPSPSFPSLVLTRGLPIPQFLVGLHYTCTWRSKLSFAFQPEHRTPPPTGTSPPSVDLPLFFDPFFTVSFPFLLVWLLGQFDFCLRLFSC